MKRKPTARKIPYTAADFFAAYEFLAQGKSHHVLLESGRGGRYSIAGLNPIAIAEGKDGITTIQYKDEILFKEGDPFRAFTEWFRTLETETNNEYPDFQGGAIGFLSYDYTRYIESLKMISIDDLDTPDLFFLVFDDVAVYDHENEWLWLITHSQDASEHLDELETMWRTASNAEGIGQEERCPDLSDGNFSDSLDESSFTRAVDKIKKYIAGGDVFQVNLSLRQSEKISVPPYKIYQAMKKINPSPYMAYLEAPDFQIICGSPELLIKKTGALLETRPIAGTRSRGKDDLEDEKLANELIHNEKERAEHVMLVDLERNDVGKVSEYGSVHVNEFMVIEKYSHVMHIVSNVQGTMKPEYDAADLVHAVFPGGTITGAPKVRTMEIIEELEPTRRGVYTGSIGWFGFNQDVCFNIVIRSIYVKGNHAFMQSGAGVVIDSNPKHEYKEAHKKATALKKALELSQAEKNTSMR